MSDLVCICRTALLINYQKTKDTGYLTRKLNLDTLDNIIGDIEDCGTKQYVECKIIDSNHLKRLRHRYYLKNNKETLIDINDKSLIGKTIKMRSPIKCACGNGKICHRCYGDLWKYNYDKNIGIIAVLLLTDPLISKNLSAKHNIQGKAIKVDWGDDFTKYFSVNKNQILINSTSGIRIKIKEYYEDEESYNDTIKFDTLIISGKKKEEEIKLPIMVTVNTELYDIDTYYSNKNDEYVIECKDFLDGDPMFTFNVNNNELSASLSAITQLIETNHFIKEHTIDEVYQEFIRLLIETDIYIDSVHIEVILKELCKIKDNNRALFKKKESPIEDIIRLPDAILSSNRTTVSIIYEKLYSQLGKLETFLKNGSSIFDNLIQ